MVARIARWSHGRFLGRASKPRLSRDFVWAKSRVVIGRGCTELTGFPVVHQKTTRFLGWSTKPRLKTEGSSIRPVWKVGLTGLTIVRRCSQETSKWRTHVEIAWLASRLRRCGRRASVWWCEDKRFSECPSGACNLVLGLRGSFGFWLPPYNPSGERMAAISWNPSQFVLLFSSSLFPLEFLG
jgi:hypothetical protein